MFNHELIMSVINPQRIAIIRRNRLGDMICTLPLIHALRNRFPQTEILVVSDSAGCELARWSPEVSQVHLFKNFFLKFLNPWMNKSSLKGADLVIAAKGGFDRGVAKVVCASGSPIRIGFDPHSPSAYYSHPIPLPDYEHQIKTLFRLLLPLGIEEPQEYCFNLTIPSVDSSFLNWGCGSDKKKILITLTCNRGQYWPLENYFQLIDRLEKMGGIQVGVMKRPEETLSMEITERLRSKGVALFEPSSLAVVANLLKSADGFISPEGGLVHLAACTETPTVVLWRPDGVIQKWGSKSKTHLDLQPSCGIENLSVDAMLDQIQGHFL